ncbi:MAG: tRNA (adenosine(37)-N6)-dimethylallyltransferase MiaA [Gemmataceae bacterium]
MIPPFQNALVLTGPTGAGKSALALALAERKHAEIISMDSMALYRGMDIGTAKPDRAMRARVPHHLIDVLDPWESASVAWWLERAAEACRDIQAQGRRALIVGGTPLYLKALMFGLFPGPPGDPQVRGRLEEVAASAGAETLHRRLQDVDPETAARLHPNDVRRVVRALEVFELTGRPISAWQTQWQKSEEAGSPIYCVELPREELYARIDARVLAMFDAGLLEEVKRLQQLSKPMSRAAAQALGYKEVLEHLDGRASLAETVERVQTRSRNFAKRQLTWFRHLPGCTRLGPAELAARLGGA